ncbi:MAG TPA: GNAT family N-acetyltransferase [Caulobacteraceae bacterium]|nr:GNAT family N-acetyltransferase [Caulobacteraceae bacterium]
MRARRWRADETERWNAFNARAVTGHFLFDRGFMDYHADRFADASLVVEDAGEVVALLPLNRAGEEAWSHQGLTFGGLIHGGLGASAAMQALDACCEALKAEGATTLMYKALPWIYPARPAQEDLYWLQRRGAALVRRDLSSSIDYRARGPVSGRRERGARKAVKAGVAFAPSTDWAGYWTLLERVLGERHGVKPVHALAEIERLAACFPGQIALHVATLGGDILAGVVMFASAQVAHAQYIAVGEAGRQASALDGLFDRLIAQYAASHRYFDFGVSTTDQGRQLNEGLVRQKEEFGAGAVAYDVYRLAL